MKNIVLLQLCLLFLISCNTTNVDIPENKESQLQLKSNWKLMRSMDVSSNVEEISKLEFNSSTWLSTSVPTTVMNALVENKIVKQPFLDSNLALVDSNLFASSWYFRHEFTVTEVQTNLFSNLHLDGINYRAKVWLNGKSISSELLGAYRTFKLPTSGLLKEGSNVLLVEVTAPQPGDFTVGFVDWAPTPPDKNMGIWRPVYLSFSGAVDMYNTFVKTDVDTATLNSAELTIETTLKNNTNAIQKGEIEGVIENIQFSYSYELAANEVKTVTITAKDIAELVITNPRLWWPHDYGTPEMYQLKLTNKVGALTSATETIDFGIREVGDYFNEKGHKGFTVNGKPIQIKGGGWVDNLFLADSTFSNKTQLEYAKNMNLNTIRFEGYWGNSQEIYSLCDKMGLLAMVGWSCQWEWEAYLLKDFPEEEELGGIVTPEEMELTAAYFKDMVLWLRNHPSIFTYTAGSDFLPRPALEKMYLKVLEDHDPTRPYLGAAKQWESPVSGSTGVKMEGPYDWVPPVYWYSDTLRGGAFGFNTETGPGPQPPVLESIQKMISKENQWPIENNKVWNYHNGRHEFGTMKRYMKGLDNRYGKSNSLERFAYIAQIASYESIRPMFEAFSSNKPNSTGVIQWMLNSAWPETFWQLYDYYLVPTGAYYGTKKGCSPLNVSYNYATNEIKVVNDTRLSKGDFKVKMEVYNANSQLISNEVFEVLDLEANMVKLVTTLKPSNDPLRFLKLTLTNSEDIKVANNFYWLSLKPDVMEPDYKKSSWIYTPTTELADFTLLNSLPKTSITIEKVGEKYKVTNKGTGIAFGIELKAYTTTNQFVEALVFSDNYFSLLPGEEKVVSVKSYNYKGELLIKHHFINKE